MSVSEIGVPDAKLVEEVLAYAKRELNVEIFNHSMRVYYYGALRFLVFDFELKVEQGKLVTKQDKRVGEVEIRDGP